MGAGKPRNVCGISIHALLAESDLNCLITRSRRDIFLSTLSLRRATRQAFCDIAQHTYFYPRSPCGERPGGKRQDLSLDSHFYPRSPCGERLCGCSGRCLCWEYFYPRSPCGERPYFVPALKPKQHFYPRSPCGERPILPYLPMAAVCISIHALLAESDSERWQKLYLFIIFLSTLSLRRATVAGRPNGAPLWAFLSTLSLRRATFCCFLGS